MLRRSFVFAVGSAVLAAALTLYRAIYTPTAKALGLTVRVALLARASQALQ